MHEHIVTVEQRKAVLCLLGDHQTVWTLLDQEDRLVSDSAQVTTV